MAKREVISDSHIEKLLEKLNNDYKDWTILGTIQEHGMTKVLIEKEENV